MESRWAPDPRYRQPVNAPRSILLISAGTTACSLGIANSPLIPGSYINLRSSRTSTASWDVWPVVGPSRHYSLTAAVYRCRYRLQITLAMILMAADRLLEKPMEAISVVYKMRF